MPLKLFFCYILRILCRIDFECGSISFHKPRKQPTDNQHLSIVPLIFTMPFLIYRLEVFIIKMWRYDLSKTFTLGMLWVQPQTWDKFKVSLEIFFVNANNARTLSFNMYVKYFEKRPFILQDMQHREHIKGVRNVSFLENFLYIPNQWSPMATGNLTKL